jgi:hypothetical protein
MSNIFFQLVRLSLFYVAKDTYVFLRAIVFIFSVSVPTDIISVQILYLKVVGV